LSYLAAQPRTVEILGQQVYLCHQCDQPIFSISVLSSGRVVHVPMCPLTSDDRRGEGAGPRRLMSTPSPLMATWALEQKAAANRLY
jgi:hypothetical protein